MASMKKILVVDDNVDAADMTAEILRVFGLKVLSH
jgi:CheY-like chemotaxis protein